MRIVNLLLVPVLAVALFTSGCKTKEKSSVGTTKTQDDLSAVLDSVVIDKKPRQLEPVVYQASATRVNDIIHTSLEVSFDWTKSQLKGKATITAKPYFYPVNSVDLDARGFDVHKVALVENKNQKDLKYTYDGKVITVDLGREYKNDEQYVLFIDYTAKPEELEKGGSAAISSDKGLYFINPLGKEPGKPRQIWTQGETQSSSCWFPTIDRPNERMTNEIFITIEKNFVTLSNGELVSSKENAGGTRTDHWKMDLPHAPYLVMMAIGEYSVVKDSWRNKKVDYYVEPAYEPHAKAIFGNTPEMLEFYSKILGVDYPWNKYAQIVVRDYVSGAMENTTAVIHGEFLQQTDRELLDGDNEAIIAHELFHHWFGDLVTCESWANLPLNESFATYGEYMWMEHKYGRDAADFHGQESMNGYMREASSGKNEDMIRYDYIHREEMFDGHSYNKGGRILHMLRKYVGDKAFYESLKLYLEKNKFTAVEIHELRLAFEEVTGEDLNWFFNQWFLSGGHPELEIEYSYEAGKANVKISQTHNTPEDLLYKIPMKVDVYANGKKATHDIVITKSVETFSFPSETKPDLINADAEKMLLGTKNENKTIGEMVFQFKNAPLYLDRYEAVTFLGKNPGDASAKETLIQATKDKFWMIRVLALQKAGKELSKDALITIATKDEKATVRALAVEILAGKFPEDPSLIATYKLALNDRSYNVIGEALTAIANSDPAQALELAKPLEKETSSDILLVLSSLYSKHGNANHISFFEDASKKLGGFDLFLFITNVKKFTMKHDHATAERGLQVLGNSAKNSGMSWVKMVGLTAISDVQRYFHEDAESLESKINQLQTENPNAAELPEMKRKQSASREIASKAEALHNEIKAQQ